LDPRSLTRIALVVAVVANSVPRELFFDALGTGTGYQPLRNAHVAVNLPFSGVVELSAQLEQLRRNTSPQKNSPSFS